MILMEQITTVNQSDLKDCLGKVREKALIRNINAALMRTFGIWQNNSINTGDIRCLCQKHLQEYKLLLSVLIRSRLKRISVTNVMTSDMIMFSLTRKKYLKKEEEL